MDKDRKENHDQKSSNGGKATFPAISHADAVEEIGTQIGPYKLLSILGEGGFGKVYRAEQKQPIRRQVALKVIKPGMDTKQVIARFEAERQALALLDHPSIARVLEAGTTETGRPYFVMEYVKGEALTDHCDHKKLDIEERLQLFVQICEAVQYAHQKGIIHRDIKPSNIMVSTQGDQAIPKIIDFGVAKAISQPLTEKTLFTARGQLIGTPEYMSPEQAELTNPDIDTRTDIYSLGVLLYELLTGTLPFDRKTLHEAAFDEIMRIIRDEDPPRPSTRLSSLGEDAQKVAASRSTEVKTLAKCLHKELEWIPMKAMRKEPGRRYKTASELADDVRNYLNGVPLVAGPESATYRVKKLVKRHQALVTGVAVVIAVLVAGTIVSTIFAIGQTRERHRAENAERLANERLGQALKAQSEAEQARASEETQRKLVEETLREVQAAKDAEEKERRRAEVALEKGEKARKEANRQAEIAENVVDFFTYDLLGAVDPDKLTSQNVSIRYILDAATENLGGRLQIAPLIEARIRRTIGLMYLDLGLYKSAEDNLDRALKFYRENLREEDRDTLGSMNNLGLAYKDQGRYGEAEQLFSKALKIGRSALNENDPWLLKFMSNLANLYIDQSRYDEAEILYKEGLEVSRRGQGEEHPYTLKFMDNLARFYATCPNDRLRDGQKAIEYARKTCELTSWKNQRYVNTFAIAYAEVGDFESAVERLKSVDRLDLSDSAITDPDLEHLAKFSFLRNLRLDNTKITDSGLAHLKGLTSLKELYLSGTQITDAGLSYLENLTGLQSLCMHNTKVGGPGLVYLRGMSALRDLCLHDTQVSDTDVVHIKDLKQLRSLKLYSTLVTDAGLENLRDLRSLEYLDLDQTHITDKGLECLRELRSLDRLYLTGTDVTDVGLVHLKNLTHLQYLYLRDTRVSDGGLSYFERLTSLRVLDLFGTQVTESGVDRLKRILPDCSILIRRSSVVAQQEAKPGETKPAIAKFVIPEDNLRIPEELQSCAEHLQKIYTAIKQYEEDNNRLPNNLSDLVPAYVSEEILWCPNDPARSGMETVDSNVPYSYGYEFSSIRISRSWPIIGGRSFRDWKYQQMTLFGNVVPMVRCSKHGATYLNASADGTIYVSPNVWERMFIPGYTHGDEFRDVVAAEPPLLPGVEKPAPSFTLRDLNGNQVGQSTDTSPGQGDVLLSDESNSHSYRLMPIHKIMGTIVNYYRPIRITLSDQPSEELHKEPKYGAERPLYGTMQLGDGEDRFVTIVVDEPEGGPERIYIDCNNDEDLTNDGEGAWSASSSSSLSLSNVRIEVDYTTGQIPYTFSFYRFKTRLRDVVLYYRDSARQGEIVSSGETYKITVVDENADGRFDDLDNGTLLIDLNQDGKLVGRSDSAEQHEPNKPFNIHGKVWSIDKMSADGSTMVLKPSMAEAEMRTYLEPGYPAPAFSGNDLEGNSIELSKEARLAKYVLLDFWASWCGPCREEFPYLRRLHAGYKDRGLHILGVNLDNNRDAAQQVVQENGLDYPHVFDGLGWKNAVAVQYRVSAIPQTYLLDSNLNIVAKNLRGAGLEQKIAALLGPADNEASKAAEARRSESLSARTQAAQVGDEEVDRAHLPVRISLEHTTDMRRWGASYYPPKTIQLSTEDPPQDWFLPQIDSSRQKRFWAQKTFGSNTVMNVVVHTPHDPKAGAWDILTTFDEDVDFRPVMPISIGVSSRTEMKFNVAYGNDAKQPYVIRIGPNALNPGCYFLSYWRSCLRTGTADVLGKEYRITLIDDDSDGLYSIRAGTTVLVSQNADGHIILSDRVQADCPIRIGQSQYFTIEISDDGSSALLLPAEYGILEGSVIHESSNTPVPNAHVKTSPYGFETLTSADGRYEMRLPAGRYNEVQITAGGFIPDHIRRVPWISHNASANLSVFLHAVTFPDSGEVTLRDGDSFHFLSGQRGKYTGGDFYFIFSKGGPKFCANNQHQRGLVDLGPIQIPLYSVTPSAQGYTQFGVSAEVGHVYVSHAKQGEEGCYILFTVTEIEQDGSCKLRYYYRQAEVK